MNETLNNQTANNQQQMPAFGGTQQMAIGQPPMMNGQPPMMTLGGMSAIDGTQQAFDPTQMPMFDASQMPSFDPSQMQTGDVSQLPTIDGTQEMTFDPTQMPAFDGTQQAFDPTQMTAFDGAQQLGQPPMMFGQGFMQAPPDMNMWGNSELTGEQVLNGDNFTAPADLGEITDTSGANIDVNSFGNQNSLGFPPAGMMPPPMMGNGGQFAQPEQAASTEQETK